MTSYRTSYRPTVTIMLQSCFIAILLSIVHGQRNVNRTLDGMSTDHLLLFFCSSNCCAVITQRNPTWDMPVSGVQPMRALGR